MSVPRYSHGATGGTGWNHSAHGTSSRYSFLRGLSDPGWKDHSLQQLPRFRGSPAAAGVDGRCLLDLDEEDCSAIPSGARCVASTGPACSASNSAPGVVLYGSLL